MQYVDALRLGDVAAFRRLEPACEGWYSPGLDRGAGAALHFAVDHGRLEAVKFLVRGFGGRRAVAGCGGRWYDAAGWAVGNKRLGSKRLQCSSLAMGYDA